MIYLPTGGVNYSEPPMPFSILNVFVNEEGPEKFPHMYPMALIEKKWECIHIQEKAREKED